MEQLGSKDSSCKLLSSRVFSFVNNLYLVLHAYRGGSRTRASRAMTLVVAQIF